MPQFTDEEYNFEVPGNAVKGHIIGKMEVISRFDGERITNVEFSLVEENEYIDIDERTGELKVIKDLMDPPGTKERRRRKRSLEEDNIRLEIMASLGEGQSDITVIEIAVNRTCEGCALLSDDNKNFSGTTLVIIVVIAIIVVVAIVTGIICYVKRRGHRTDHIEATPQNKNYSDQHTLHPDPTIDPYFKNNCESSERSSSGRGSAEDEEIEMITNSSPSNVAPKQEKPDSGIQQDNVSGNSVPNCTEYLADLGINHDNITRQIQPKLQKNLGTGSSVESMHHFSDEGGGEAVPIDINTMLFTHPSELEASKYNTNGNSAFIKEMPSQFSGDGSSRFVMPEQQNSAKLSSIINSEEELSGSYGWDYLLDWGPQYQPLAHVFNEIASLKDDNIVPKKQPTQFVIQPKTITRPKINGPPPIITGAPPLAVLAHPQNFGGSHHSSSSGTSGTRTSLMTSLPSLPRSPISHESSFTSTAFSPSFTPSLSPLATRSPTISSLGGTPKSTPRGSRHHHENTLFIAASSESEQEIRI